MPAPSPTPFRIGDVDGRQPGAARAAGRDRQLVRAPAGAPPRRGAGGLRDGLELRGCTTATSARCSEMLRIHPDEHPVSIQLFGHDPEVMRAAAAIVAEAGADLIDINMGCPVPKVFKTGAGAALLRRSRPRGRRRPRGAEGSGLPVTVKLRSGTRARRPSGRRARAAAGRGGGRRGDRPAPAARGQRTRAAPTTRSSPSSSRDCDGPVPGDRLRRARDAPRGARAPTASRAPTR